MASPERNTTIARDESVKTVESTKLTQQVSDLKRTDYQLWKKVTESARGDSDLKSLGFRDAKEIIDFSPDKTRSNPNRTSDRDRPGTATTSTGWQEKRQQSMKSQGDEINKNGSRKIQQGDTLWDIAHSHLKLSNKDNKSITNRDIAREVERLAKINKLENPNKIASGKEIRMNEKPDDRSRPSDKERTNPNDKTKPSPDKGANPADKLDEKYRRTEKNEDGSEVQFDKYNRVTRLKPENMKSLDIRYDQKGNVSELDYQNGSVYKRSDDGKYHEYRDGKPTGRVHDFQVQITRDGEVICKYRDGSSHINRRDGSSTQFDKEGRVTRHRYADGTSTEFAYEPGTKNVSEYTWHDKNGKETRRTRNENGVWKTKEADKEVNTWKGSIQVRPDGAMEFKGTDGSTFVTNRRDGKLSTQKETQERAAREKQEREERERKYAAPF